MDTRDHYEALARKRLIQGDLFTYENIVVPIKTEGRWYGSISQRVAEVITFPRLTLCESKIVAHGGKNYILVAIWSDTVEYSDKHIADCASSAIFEASHAQLKHIAMPLLGGKEGMKYIGAMEWAIDHATDLLENIGMLMPEVVFVTR